MIRISMENFNLKQIAESGQCFRWKQLDKKGMCFEFISGSKSIAIHQHSDNMFDFYCNEEEFTNTWIKYFDICGTNYGAICRKMEAYGGLLEEAAKEGAGIRILRQDPWEMLITFLTAQNISIPRVTTLIEKLCNKYGQKVEFRNTVSYATFPSSESLAKAKPEELRELGFGYRDKQIITAARIAASGAVDLDKLKKIDHDTAKLILTNIYGVGDKVAECISLFGLGKLESYPIDTWVQKIEDYFGHGYIQKEFPDHAGIVQQYLFAYVRRHGLPERGKP